MHESPVPICPYCLEPAVFEASSAGIYGADYGPRWVCASCGASVGVHKGTRRPLGRLADRTLRVWKRRAHLAFDPLWLQARDAYPEIHGSIRHITRIARTRAYLWLADQMRLSVDECHIGTFDVEHCREVIAIVQRENPTAATIRAWAKARTLPGDPP